MYDYMRSIKFLILLIKPAFWIGILNYYRYFSVSKLSRTGTNIIWNRYFIFFFIKKTETNRNSYFIFGEPVPEPILIYPKGSNL